MLIGKNDYIIVFSKKSSSTWKHGKNWFGIAADTEASNSAIWQWVGTGQMQHLLDFSPITQSQKFDELLIM